MGFFPFNAWLVIPLHASASSVPVADVTRLSTLVNLRKRGLKGDARSFVGLSLHHRRITVGLARQSDVRVIYTKH